ncbi:NADP-dependent oxidoreductase domain-containing protein [Haematococcus lacustris]
MQHRAQRNARSCRGPSAPAALPSFPFLSRSPPPPRLADRITIAPGLKVSRMGLGTWSWGNQFLWGYRQEQDAELQQVFNLVVQRGLNLFDTADSYGTGRLDGRSEKLLGRFMQECPKRKADLVIATKLAGYPWRVLPSLVVDAAKASCERLGTQQLGLVQLHWSASNYAPWQELAQQAGLADCYDQGLCKAVGVSNFGAKRLRQLHAYLSKRGVPLATVQIQFSLLSRTPLVLETKAVADELGIRLISYSPLALGLLSGKYSQDSLPSGPRGLLFRSLLPEIQPLLSTMEAIGNERNKTMSQVAINWCCAKGTIPIPGARTLSQAQEALGALDWLLSDGEVAELDAAAARTPKAMVQNIFQTS